MSRERSAGQAIAELAIVMPILALLGLGAADVGIHGLRQAIAGNGATSIAALLAQDVPADDPRIVSELERSCPGGSLSMEEAAPLITANLTCPAVSLTTLLPGSVGASGSAVRAQPAPEPPMD